MFPPVVDLALTLLMCLVPSILFIGLYRGLEAMRDDDLINAWLADPGTKPPESAVVRRTMGLEADEAVPAGDRDHAGPGATRCSNCGRTNPDYALLCSNCLRKL
jgi:hypothetical protein